MRRWCDGAISSDGEWRHKLVFQVVITAIFITMVFLFLLLLLIVVLFYYFHTHISPVLLNRFITFFFLFFKFAFECTGKCIFLAYLLCVCVLFLFSLSRLYMRFSFFTNFRFLPLYRAYFTIKTLYVVLLY